MDNTIKLWDSKDMEVVTTLVSGQSCDKMITVVDFTIQITTGLVGQLSYHHHRLSETLVVSIVVGTSVQ